MNFGLWRFALPAFLSLACLEIGAAEGILQLAILHAAPEIEPDPEPAPRSPPSEHAARKSLGNVNFYDSGNPDLGRLQRYEDAVANLPMDANGFPDWMSALRESGIQPKTGLKSNPPMNILNLDVIMKNTREMPFVRFPHHAHTLWLDCSNCHPVPFEKKAGTTPITMTDIFRGKYCGMCHDRIAFITFFSCQRCHSVPQPVTTAPPE